MTIETNFTSSPSETELAERANLGKTLLAIQQELQYTRGRLDQIVKDVGEHDKRLVSLTSQASGALPSGGAGALTSGSANGSSAAGSTGAGGTKVGAAVPAAPSVPARDYLAMTVAFASAYLAIDPARRRGIAHALPFIPAVIGTIDAVATYKRLDGRALLPAAVPAAGGALAIFAGAR
jgi:hypothetical protein